MYYLHTIDPVALQLGPVAIHWYGLMYLLAFGVFWWLGTRRVRQGRLPVSLDAYSDLLFYGMLGVLTALWWWSRRQGQHFFDTVDFVAPLVPPGLGLGRLGNWIGGELWGRVSDVPWAVIFPKSLPDPFYSLDAAGLEAAHRSGALDAFARHPSQLYQAVFEGVVMVTLMLWYSARPRPRYAVSGLFGLLYGIGRFAIEFVREPDAQLGYLAFGWLTMGQLLSLPMIGVGLWLLWLSRRAPTQAVTVRAA